MKYLLLITLTLFLNIAQASQVLVVVDHKAITTVDLNKRMDALRILYPGITFDENAKKQILNNLVSEELFHNEAERLKISISKEEIDDRFKEMQQEYHLSQNQLDAWKANKSLLQQVEGQLLWSKLVSSVFYNKVKVSEAEIREEQKLKKFEISEVDFKQLIFTSYESAKLNIIKTSATNCSDFDSISLSNGLGRPYHNILLFKDLNPELQSVIKGLSVNQMSDVINLEGMQQIIMLCNKKMVEKNISAETIKQELSTRKINAEAQKYLSELKKRIYVEYENPVR